MPLRVKAVCCERVLRIHSPDLGRCLSGYYDSWMVDRLNSSQRSLNMSRIRGVNTSPELVVRKMLRDSGFGYRLHASDLPGRPDIVFRGRRKVISVNGCFWHSHECKYGAATPSTNATFWSKKRRATVERDRINHSLLVASGWDELVVWECELKERELLRKRLVEFLQG
jgi:DNA mismatch endonuclease (patch repair protein)